MSLLALVLGVTLSGTKAVDRNVQGEQKELSLELSVSELGALSRAVNQGNSFVAAANKGQLVLAKGFCAKKIDSNVESVGDVDKVLGHTSSKEFQKAWAPKAYKLRAVTLARKASGLYFYVWMRASKGKWDGDLALITKASSGKIVSIFDAAE